MSGVVVSGLEGGRGGKVAGVYALPVTSARIRMVKRLPSV